MFLALYHITSNFNDPKIEAIVGKGENAGINQHFLLFPQCFLPYHDKELKAPEVEKKCLPVLFDSFLCLQVYLGIPYGIRKDN